jgi:hypothetical protein
MVSDGWQVERLRAGGLITCHPPLIFSARKFRSSSPPHRYILLLQKRFYAAHGGGAEMEYIRGEEGVGLAAPPPGGQMFQTARAADQAQLTVESFRHAAPPVDVAVKIFFLAVRFTRGRAETFPRAVDGFHHAAPAGFGTAKAFQHTVKPCAGAVKAFRDTVKPSGGMVK